MGSGHLVFLGKRPRAWLTAVDFSHHNLLVILGKGIGNCLPTRLLLASSASPGPLIHVTTLPPPHLARLWQQLQASPTTRNPSLVDEYPVRKKRTNAVLPLSIAFCAVNGENVRKLLAKPCWGSVALP